MTWIYDEPRPEPKPRVDTEELDAAYQVRQWVYTALIVFGFLAVVVAFAIVVRVPFDVFQDLVGYCVAVIVIMMAMALAGVVGQLIGAGIRRARHRRTRWK